MYDDIIHQLPGALVDIVGFMLQIPKTFSNLGCTRYGYKKLSLATHKTRWQLEIYSTIPDVIHLFLLKHKGSRVLQHSDFKNKNEEQIFLWDCSNRATHNFHSLNHVFILIPTILQTKLETRLHKRNCLLFCLIFSKNNNFAHLRPCITF